MKGTDFLESLIGAELEVFAITFAITLARIAPLTIIAPFFALKDITPILRSFLIVAFSLAMSLPIMGQVNIHGALVTTFAQELAIGFLFALFASLPFYAIEWSGRYIDTWRGASMAEVYAPLSGARSSPLGTFQLLVAISIFFLMDGHIDLLRIVKDSIVTSPPGHAIWLQPQAHALVSELVSQAFIFSFVLAAPAALGILLGEVSLGLIARSAPKVPVFFAGMPLRAAIGIGALLVSLPYTLDAATEGMADMLNFLRSGI